MSAPPVKKTATKKAASHPKYVDMIKEAIIKSGEKTGLSRPAIKKYIFQTYKLDPENKTVSHQIAVAIAHGAEKGEFTLPKGIGGKVKVSAKAKADSAKAEKKVAAPAAAKAAPAKKPAAKKATAAKKTTTAKKPAATVATKKAPAAKTASSTTAKATKPAAKKAAVKTAANPAAAKKAAAPKKK